MKNKKKKIKVLALLSGGLDSILAIRLLQEQSIEVTGLTFVSYFFEADKAKTAAKQLKIELKIFDFSAEHLALIKKPVYGYGKAMNPCIDCHALMLKKAKQLLQKEGYAAIATGEVLGQRPMSQNRQALKTVAREAGLEELLIRPLSARLLDQTILEKRGLIDRSRLLAISGRSRQEQLKLAKKWGIKEYPSPAGGCLLTDLEFGKKLKEALSHWPSLNGPDVALLRLGRHFWSEECLIVLGRNHQENLKLRQLTKTGDVVIEAKAFPGPTVLIRTKTKILEKTLRQAADLIIKYSPKAPSKA